MKNAEQSLLWREAALTLYSQSRHALHTMPSHSSHLHTQRNGSEPTPFSVSECCSASPLWEMITGHWMPRKGDLLKQWANGRTLRIRGWWELSQGKAGRSKWKGVAALETTKGVCWQHVSDAGLPFPHTSSWQGIRLPFILQSPSCGLFEVPSLPTCALPSCLDEKQSRFAEGAPYLFSCVTADSM